MISDSDCYLLIGPREIFIYWPQLTNTEERLGRMRNKKKKIGTAIFIYGQVNQQLLQSTFNKVGVSLLLVPNFKFFRCLQSMYM